MPNATDEFSRRLAALTATKVSRTADDPRTASAVPAPGRDEFSRRLAQAVARHGAAEGDVEEQVATQNAAPAESASASVDRHATPAGAGEVLVCESDCITRIAAEHGHLTETIWEDPANSPLREAGRDPNILLPGDRVHVPPIRPKVEPATTEMRHRFRRKAQPSRFSLILKRNDQPRANEPYELRIDAEVYHGVTDPEGKLQQWISPTAKKGLLRIGNDRRAYEIVIGRLDPIDAISGVQQRLNNLGFKCGAPDGLIGPRTEQALRAFQTKNNLEVTGRADDATRRILVLRHGS